MKKSHLALLALLALPAAAMDGPEAFAKLKSLAGEWKAASPMGEAKITVEVIAGGSSILQREHIGRMEEMVTLFHLDGKRLLLTHYCMTGNQPRMEARAFDAKTGELRFEFLDATNLAKPTDGHMRNVSLRFVNNDTVHQDWEFFQGGKRTTTESLDYHRVK